MKWDDDLLLEKTDRIRGQLQLASYAVHLSAGHTLTAKSIKVKTIKEYVYAAASFLQLFTGVDFRYDSEGDKTFGSFLSHVYTDLERFEQVPNRREPYTPEMHQQAEAVAATFRHQDHRTKIPAMTDGFGMALMAGFRLGEWAQHSAKYTVRNPMQNHLAPPQVTTRAICPLDLRVETVDHQRLIGLDILSVPLRSIRKMWIRFRTQKNGHHGEERLYTFNEDGHCFVTYAYNSLLRFRDLMKLESFLTPISPLACYWDPEHRMVRLINADDIEDFMRSLAVQVYNLHPVRDKKELQKWSAHSLRVGACVLLHVMGFPALDIQWLLRWRSNAFMAYLRNLAGLADRQHRAVDRAGAMPHLF